MVILSITQTYQAASIILTYVQTGSYLYFLETHISTWCLTFRCAPDCTGSWETNSKLGDCLIPILSYLVRYYLFQVWKLHISGKITTIPRLISDTYSKMKTNIRLCMYSPNATVWYPFYLTWSGIINPRRTCAARVTVVILCVCVSVCPFSLFCLLALLGVQREVSAATAKEMQ